MSKAWRWPPTQPIAAWIASCRSPSVISPGIRRRRQTGGLVPYSVTLRLRGALLAVRVCAAVLAMIFISHRAPPISAFCARPVMMASELRAVRQEPGLKGEADGLKDRDVPASGRLKHGPDIGVERGPPRGSKAVGDLAEHNAGPERLFGAIVGWRDGAVGDEHEQVLAEALDDPLELLSGRGHRRDREQDVEPFLKPGLVEHERAVGQGLAPAANANGPFQEPHHARSKGRVTGIHCILNIADQVSEADLMVHPRPSDLGAEAVGNPNVGATVAQERLDDLLAAARRRDETGAIGMMEDPGPEGPLAHAGRCFVGLKHGA